MKAFAQLCLALEAAASADEKAAALARHFAERPPADAAWGVRLLTGPRPPRSVEGKLLREWACETAGVSPWLFEETYAHVGDLAETIALIMPGADDGRGLAAWLETSLLPLRTLSPVERPAAALAAWSALDRHGRWVWTKLAAGTFRTAVPAPLLARALAMACAVPAEVVVQRLSKPCPPTAAGFQALVAADHADGDAGRPHAFQWAGVLATPPEELGDPAAWHAEWLHEGLRAQLLRRGGAAFVWTRAGELATARFPELVAGLPEAVLDGMIVPAAGTAWAGFARRLLRQPDRKLLAEAPVAFLAFDLLEHAGEDLRSRPFVERRRRLETLSAPALRIAPAAGSASWAALAELRRQRPEPRTRGLVLKRQAAPYGGGREAGDWWKWRFEPQKIDAVLLDARPAAGGVGGEYTFGVRTAEGFAAVATTGVEDAALAKALDEFVRAHTVEKFGPVRTVRPALVCELAFAGIDPAPRRKAGLALRGPRALRRRDDLRVEDAGTLMELQALLDPAAAD